MALGARWREVLARLAGGPRTGDELAREIPDHWWHGPVVLALFDMEMADLIASTPGDTELGPRIYRLTPAGAQAARAAGIALTSSTYRRGD